MAAPRQRRLRISFDACAGGAIFGRDAAGNGLHDIATGGAMSRNLGRSHAITRADSFAYMPSRLPFYVDAARADAFHSGKTLFGMSSSHTLMLAPRSLRFDDVVGRAAHGQGIAIARGRPSSAV